MFELFEYAKEVGNNAATYFNDFKKKNKPVKIKQKEDDSPLFNYDLAIDKFIRSKLKITEIPVITEESYKKNTPLNDEYWVIDPIDGSKEMNNGKGIMTINIALIKNNYPLFGVINTIHSLDSISEQYTGYVKETSQYQIKSKGDEISLDRIKLITSKNHLTKKDNVFISVNGFSNISKSSSASKFIKVALSENDVYARFSGCSEWDSAAGQAIVESSRGKVIDLTTLDRMKYGKHFLRNNPFIVLRKNIELIDFNIESLKIKLHESNYFSGW